MKRSLSRHERRPAAAILFAAAVVAMSFAGSTARGEETVRQVLPGAPAAEPPQQLTREKAPDQSEIERFCSNIADAARDRRYALQAEEMKQLQAGIDQRMKALEEKRAEYETWLKRREVFLARAEDGVVQIYAGMKPDAAAERLAIVNADLAAAILMKLDSRKASVILNEMDQTAAATLTGIMASAARRVDPS
ncbi:flagellar motility protein MotE (MotC chaperone) [Mesorhizobium sangaii]|uniref:Flagellar motility protein MotE (MotC chaperone) n=2 Tax=Mesorhizobium sangaii TaxID=505389 RepID=A0A841PCY8_9HYPH|nr:flagellar motility protein MotE (MotC chaperone) [Mesorhizobium sangaii]